MKTRLTIAILAICIFGSAMVSAQGRQLSDDDRDRFLSEMRIVKHEYMVRELKLTKEQQNEFFPIYDRMEDDINRINAETRELEQAALNDANATDTQVEAAARATFEQKEREARIELEAYDKFKTILTPQQLLRLRATEKKFTQNLMRQHRKAKEKNR